MMPYVVIATRRRGRYIVRCPKCRRRHRHADDGTVTAPCGTVYAIVPPAPQTGRRGR